MTEPERLNELVAEAKRGGEDYLQGYRHALREVIQKLDTESVTLRLEFRAGKVGIEYINGIEYASDVADAMLKEVPRD